MKYQPDLCADVPIVGSGRGAATSTSCSPMSRWSGTIAADPASPALIAFTSGTTSDPKGVIHSHQTLGFETRQLLANYPPDRGRQLTATPVGHFIGMLGAFLIPVLEGAPIDLCRRVGPGQRAQADRDATGCRSAAGRRTSSPACWTIPTAPPSTCRTSKPLASAGLRCPRRSPAGWPTWASSCSAPTAAPNIRRSPGSSRDAPEDKRLFTDGNAAARCGDPARARTARSSAADRICASATPTTR